MGMFDRKTVTALDLDSDIDERAGGSRVAATFTVVGLVIGAFMALVTTVHQLIALGSICEDSKPSRPVLASMSMGAILAFVVLYGATAGLAFVLLRKERGGGATALSLGLSIVSALLAGGFMTLALYYRACFMVGW
jgi:hypothetical protein